MSVTVTEEIFGSVRKVKFAWTSDGSGDATGTTSEAYNGKIEALVTEPDGVAVPTAAYDVVVNDEDGYDVLAGAGANRSATATETVLSASLGIVANDKLTLVVANAGDTKSGVVVLYIR